MAPPNPRFPRRRTPSALSRCSLALLVAILAACSNVEKAKPRPQTAKVDRSFEISAPSIMRGTVGSQAIVEGYEPVLVRGYGLVVGLNGTGSRDTPQNLRAHMLAIAASQGVGSPNSGWGDMSPEQLLDSLDTSVVIVEGLIPPGAREDTHFDVRVVPHPRTTPQSLEGGRLWTAQLQPVLKSGELPPTGSLQGAPLAEASGPVFINPFAEPGQPASAPKDTVNRNLGRILDGGRALKDMPMKLRLANASHGMARTLQGVINSQFPREPGQETETAHGQSDETLEITVPPSFREDPERFVDLLRCTNLISGAPESTALNVRRLLLTDPSFAPQASLRWQTLGPRALPIIQELYDHPEEQPRFAALEAGAKLSDALVVPHLIDLANRGSAAVRRDAIELLAGMSVNPRIDLALRSLVSDTDLQVRLAAYEALVERHDPSIRRFEVDEKFVVDLVPSDHSLIYITQMGQPRIALLGRDLAIERPVTVAAWSDRLMIKGERPAPGGLDDFIEVYYREPDAPRGLVTRVTPSLREFVEFLGHRTTVDAPKPGLGLSYAEVVGALYQIWSQRYINADFKAEQDRLLAAILESEQKTSVAQRPEFGPESDEAPVDESGAGGPGDERGGAGLRGNSSAGAPRSELDRLPPTAPLDAGRH